MISCQNLSVTSLYGRHKFVFHVHVVAHLGTGGSLQQPVDNAFHVGIACIKAVVHVQYFPIVLILIGLVEDTQHLFHAVVHLTMQKRYLNDDAVVCQTLDKRVGKSFGYAFIFVVISVVTDIDDRLLNIAYAMS